MDLELDWLPERPDWLQAFDEAKLLEPTAALERYGLLANSRIDFARTVKLDRAGKSSPQR